MSPHPPTIVQLDGVLSAIPPSRMTVAEALNLPALCGVHELSRLLGITPSQVHRLNRRGAFDKFKVKPAIGPRCFSGLLLARFIAGEPLVDIGFGRKTFGRKRSA